MPPHRPAPVPPTIFPEELRAEQGPGQGGTISTAGGVSPPPTNPLDDPAFVSPEDAPAQGEEGAQPGSPEPADLESEASDAHGEDRYSVWEKSELQAEVDRREIAVQGSGKNGNVVKNDLVKALEQDDAKS